MPTALRWFLQLAFTNPICVRLVQGGSRRMRHFYIRAGYLFVVMVALLLLIFPASGTMSYKQVALRAAGAFEVVAYLQIALICILAPVFMAGAIAQESNPRTWDILLTSPLSAAQLVLGHLFGRLFFILALLFASLPFFALTQYFGGVPGRSILLSYLIAAGAALLVGSIAVALAVNRLAGRRAVFGYCVAMVTYIAITWALDVVLRPASGGVTFLTALNPFLAQRALLDPSGYPVPDMVTLAQMPRLQRLWMGDPVTAWCLFSGLIGLALIIGSTLTVRLVGSRSGTPWYRRMFRLGAAGATHRAPRSVWHNPIAWREAAARQATLAKMIARWAFIASGALWGVGILWAFHIGRLTIAEFRYALLVTIWTELMVIALVAVNISATAVSREREDGTLDLLLTTPLTPGMYLGGKLRGLISYLAPLIGVPIITLALVSLYVLIGGLDRTGGITSNDLVPNTTIAIDTPVVLPESALLMPLSCLAFYAFCIMVGLQWSLKSKGTISSVVITVGVVGVVAGIVGLCGWQAGQSIPIIGPVLAAANPLTLVFALVNPADAMYGPIGNNGNLTSARVSLAVGTALGVLIHLGVVYGLHANMVRTFDMTVRRLAGVK